MGAVLNSDASNTCAFPPPAPVSQRTRDPPQDTPLFAGFFAKRDTSASRAFNALNDTRRAIRTSHNVEVTWGRGGERADAHAVHVQMGALCFVQKMSIAASRETDTAFTEREGG